jgi:hypothetical protein
MVLFVLGVTYYEASDRKKQTPASNFILQILAREGCSQKEENEK